MTSGIGKRFVRIQIKDGSGRGSYCFTVHNMTIGEAANRCVFLFEQLASTKESVMITHHKRKA